MDQETHTPDPIPWFDEANYEHLDVPRQIHWEDIVARGLCPSDPRVKWESTFEEGIVLQDMYMRWCQEFERCFSNLLAKLPWANMSKADLLHILRVLEVYPTKDRFLIIREPDEDLEERYHKLIFIEWHRWIHRALDVYEEISSRVERRESKAQTMFSWEKCEAIVDSDPQERVERWDYDFKATVVEVTVEKHEEDDDVLSLSGLTIADMADLSERQLMKRIQSLLPPPIGLLHGDAVVDYGLSNQLQELWLGRE